MEIFGGCASIHASERLIRSTTRLWRNIAGCPTIQYGPGEGAQCHTVDEWLKLDSYLEAILVYAKLILSWGEKK